MNAKPTFILVLTVVLCATTLAVDSDLGCLYPLRECYRQPPWEAYGAGQTLLFTGPTEVHTNCCFLTSDFKVTIDTDSRVVALAHDTSIAFCVDVYLPTCGITGTVGPLPAGDWLFIADTITGGAMIPFHIDAPPPDPNLTLLAPKPGEHILSGSTYTVKWTDSPGKGACGGSYSLFYSTDHGGTWLPVDTNTIDGACFYDWEVPLIPEDAPCALLIAHADHLDIYDAVGPLYVYDCNEAVPGDHNADCYVDFRDYSILVSSWPNDMSFNSILQLADQWCDCRNSKDPACGY